MVSRTVLVRSVAVVVTVAASVLASSGSVAAQIQHPRVVQQTPGPSTPHLLGDGVIPKPALFAFEQVGTTMYAGGSFHSVQNPGRTTTLVRNHIVSFSATSGAITSFAPAFNAKVWAIRSSAGSLFVGGEFTAVNGVARRGVVKVNAATGAVDPAFDAALPYGRVTEIRLVNGRLLVGGNFPKRLAALDPGTGRDTGFVNLGISGQIPGGGPTDLYKFAVNPAGTRLVGVGNLTSVAGQKRYRAFIVTLEGAAATLNPWYYPPLERDCASNATVDYLRDVDFSPDGGYFVMVSTGYVPKPGDLGLSLCDAAARFETATTNPTRPTWINYTGGDTLHSVAVTGAAVYVQGHQRWLDNPGGRDHAGPGARSRPGIGAIDPGTGKALPWNPTKERGVGGRDLYVTPAGLWVGSDTRYFNNRYRWGIAFCPL